MNELIKINYDSDNPTVSGRELHEKLEIETRYNDWFARMSEYGFEEGKDFYSFLSKSTRRQTKRRPRPHDRHGKRDMYATA